MVYILDFELMASSQKAIVISIACRGTDTVCKSMIASIIARKSGLTVQIVGVRSNVIYASRYSQVQSMGLYFHRIAKKF